MRRFLPVVLTLCVVVPAVPGAVTHADDSAAQKAAREIADARERANAAADAYFKAESTLDTLSIDAQKLQAEVANLQTQVGALRHQVQEFALHRFTHGDDTDSLLLNGFNSREEQMQKAVYAQVINDTSDDEFDQLDSLNRDLAQKQKALQNKQALTEKQKATMARLRDAAIKQVEHLKAVEKQRLKDEAVKKALQAEEQRRAAAKAASSPSGSSGGSGSRPSGPSINWGGVSWVCPTGLAPVGFSDTWGEPRSGGRFHEGVDMIGSAGTELLAVVNGVAKPTTNQLGGNAILFTGDDGNGYYYAHLESWGKLGRVTKGTVIGYMGETGNAGTPHLHFEIHPGFGGPVDPYPTVRAHC